jgi:hypothetical protein
MDSMKMAMEKTSMLMKQTVHLPTSKQSLVRMREPLENLCATVNKTVIVLYGLYLNVIESECVTQLLINPIIRTRTLVISFVYQDTHHNSNEE